MSGAASSQGRWPFCSGILHADMMFAGCLVDDQRVPSVVALAKEDLAVLDTWQAANDGLYENQDEQQPGGERGGAGIEPVEIVVWPRALMTPPPA